MLVQIKIKLYLVFFFFFSVVCVRVCRITKWKTANNMNVLHSCKGFSQTSETDILFICQVWSEHQHKYLTDLGRVAQKQTTSQSPSVAAWNCQLLQNTGNTGNLLEFPG